MQGRISLTLALGLELLVCHSKVVCGSAKASGLPVQVADPDEVPERTLLENNGGTEEPASPERQSLLAKGRALSSDSDDAFASADDSAMVKAQNLLSRRDNNQPKGTVLLRSRRPKGSVLLNHRQAWAQALRKGKVLLNHRQSGRRLEETPKVAEAFSRDAPTWEDIDEKEEAPEVQEQEQVVEEVSNPQVPFTPCVDDQGELKALYANDWMPGNQDGCREHCENFGSETCIGYSFHMTYGCKLYSPAKMWGSRKSKAKSIAGIVKCAASVS